MAQALYRKWRPRTFEEVAGQEHVVRTLRNALIQGRIHHAYLFTGPRGTGKTTTARLLAKAVNCLTDDPAQRPCNECTICRAVNEGRLMDLIEIDAASNTGVDDVRELRERVGYRPSEARYKVYVVDEVHMLSNAAFNALLKTLEEPPPHAIFILATTEPQRIPATVLSRCQRLDFRRIPLADIVARLQHLAQQEEITADEAALTLIARQATGSLRDAESLLDQLTSYSSEGITAQVVQVALGTGAEELVTALTTAMADGNVGEGLAVISRAVDQGSDPRQFSRQVAEHLRALLLTRLGSDAAPLYVPDGLRETFRAQAGRFSAARLAHVLRLFNQAAVEGRTAWQPQLPLELAFVEATLPPEEAAPPASKPPDPRPVPPPRVPSPKPPPQTRTAAPSRPAPASSPETPAREIPAGQVVPASSNGPSLEAVQNCWPELLRKIRQRNLRLEAFLNSGKLAGVEGNAVLIGFPHQLHRGKVEEDANRRMVEDVLEQLLSQPVRVRCVLVHAEARAQPAPKAAPPPPPAEDRLVQDAVEKLGAQVAKRP